MYLRILTIRGVEGDHMDMCVVSCCFKYVYRRVFDRLQTCLVVRHGQFRNCFVGLVCVTGGTGRGAGHARPSVRGCVLADVSSLVLCACARVLPVTLFVSCLSVCLCGGDDLSFHHDDV